MNIHSTYWTKVGAIKARTGIYHDLPLERSYVQNWTAGRRHCAIDDGYRITGIEKFGDTFAATLRAPGALPVEVLVWKE